MKKKLDNSQFQNATASTLKAISGNLQDDREIKFLGNSGNLSLKEIRLPQILKELDNKQLTKLRGEHFRQSTHLRPASWATHWSLRSRLSAAHTAAWSV